MSTASICSPQPPAILQDAIYTCQTKSIALSQVPPDRLGFFFFVQVAYSEKEVKKILAIRCEEEDVEMDEDALILLTK